MVSNNSDEIITHKTLHFQDSLKDLKNLKKQFYSAAEYFEASYDENDGRSSMIESSKEYITKALVTTLDHFCSVADKLNSFLDENSSHFSATSNSFSGVQQRLNTFRGFVNLRGMSQHSMMVEAPRRYNVPSAEIFHNGKSMSMHRNLISCDAHKPKQEYNNPFAKSFQQAGTKPCLPLLRKKAPTKSPFTRFMSNREQAGKRSVSPLSFSLKRLGSVANGSMPPSPSHYQLGSQSVPLRAISESEITNSERETEPYTKRRKHLFKALLDVHRSRK